MPTAYGIEDQEQLYQSAFSGLLSAVTAYGYELSSSDTKELESFFARGAEKLRKTTEEENYEEALSFATGQLANRFSYHEPSEANNFATFRDFLRSFCPLDPFC
jgi:hypothetical protein